ncbi:MAG: (2Fe-2S)-binding protein [Candidatus Eremiobacteraeota bacterium]|nr:(2Fe-2S)-binding protein [Candidatus Eremiobacteraeota bacterium]
MVITFFLNGDKMTVEAPSQRRVVDLLREDLGLTGTKESCGMGDCGACTILVDGESRLSCLMYAAQIEGRELFTIEGAAREGAFHALQEAFVMKGAVQCGFCIPGMVLAGIDFLRRTPQPTREEIRRGISGNLCRCGSYQKIVDAVEIIGRQGGLP